MTGWRLFIAALLPDEATDELWRALEPVRVRHPDARWVPRENLHVTLVFLGSVDPMEIQGITAAIEETTFGTGRLQVSTDGGGGRAGGRRGGVAWLRLVGAGVDSLRRVAGELDRRLDPPGKGRVHAPHVTVARRATPALLADLSLPGIGFEVARVALYRSHPGPAGARYEALFEAELERSAPRPHRPLTTVRTGA